MLRPLALLKRYMHLWLLYRTACGCGKRTGFRQQNRNRPPARGALSKEKQKLLSARGPSGEVRHPPHRLRGGRRPKGHSAAARYLLCQKPIRQRRGSSPKGAGGFSAHFWASKSGPAGGIPAGARNAPKTFAFCAYKRHPGPGAGKAPPQRPSARGVLPKENMKSLPARGPSGEVRQSTAPITRRPAASWKFSGCLVSPLIKTD